MPARHEPHPIARRYAIVAGAVVTLAACGGGEPREALEKIASAAATTRLAAEQLRAHHVSATYARRVIEVARRQVDEVATSLDTTQVPPAARARTAAAVGAARRNTAEVARVVTTGGDGDALAYAAERVDSAKRAVALVAANLP